ncbi:MAG: hypothetical protein WC884_02595 [Candidatus Paceibacterota bacterium]
MAGDQAPGTQEGVKITREDSRREMEKLSEDIAALKEARLKMVEAFRRFGEAFDKINIHEVMEGTRNPNVIKREQERKERKERKEREEREGGLK